MSFFSKSDTIAKRLALTILLAVFASTGLYIFFSETAGVWARPALSEIGLEEQIALLVRICSATPPNLRARLADAASNDKFNLQWKKTIPEYLEKSASSNVRNNIRYLLNDPDKKIILYKAPYINQPERSDPLFGEDAYGVAISLADGSWLIFRAPHRSWGIRRSLRYILILAFVLLSTGCVAWLTSHGLVRPLKAFTAAARRFGTDPNAPPITVEGPQEIQAAIKSFNSMQMQIRRFVMDRTEMLAAISHDLRTPLTRVRLRGEFINDLDQRHRLFRDVDEMQTMVDSALDFFRDEASAEHSTVFVLSELIQVIADDLVDQGCQVTFDNCETYVYSGRSFALKRAFGNLIENACIYGREADIRVDSDHSGTTVSIKDRGPGIPEVLLETVFSPFYRVERSRSRKTGGVGLGLTSARAIVRAHGGDVMLKNLEEGGLLTSVFLPYVGSIDAS